ncbi:MAG: diaminopimelate epimerase [Candidatus Krumholzibacteria bacterium]|nr:diaminopimelate epimerase [Candidatus Krumholzibacteria bacterium]
MQSRVEFLKMHGAGNDFIVIEDLDGNFKPAPGFVSSLCTLHRGIGADGLILVRRSDQADFKMIYFNSDGSEADMCGNGARCAALFAFENDIAGRSMVFETASGQVKAKVQDGWIRINIGELYDLKLGIELKKSGVIAHFAISGVPHAVILVDEVRGYPCDDFLAMARSVRHDPAFAPAGTNVDLVSISSRNELVYRTYERGVEAETMACGTGAVAAAVVTSHMNLTDSPVNCETSGGDFLEVEFDRVPGGARNCSLKGTAVFVFKGSFLVDNFLSSSTDRVRS